MHHTWRAAAVAWLAFTLLGTSACGVFSRPEPRKDPLARCKEDLKMAALPIVAEPNGQGNGEEARPLDGMEIALTVNGMLQGRADPDADPDDWCYAENSPENLQKFIGALQQHGLPPTVNFVIGSELDRAMEEAWLRSGNLVGGVVYSRMRIRKKSAEVYTADLRRNDELLGALLKQYPQKQKYFRFLRLQTGSDARKRADILDFVRRQGYVEVPATVYVDDYDYAQVYCAALARGDQACARFVTAQYKDLLLAATRRARDVARRMAGRETRHVLAIGMHQLTCDTLVDILKTYKALGARFIPLDAALADPLFTRTAAGDSQAMTVMLRTRRAQRASAAEAR